MASKFFDRRRKVHSYEFEKWLKEELQLSKYQMDLLIDNELVRFSPFTIYKEIEIFVAWYWRLTILVWPAYWMLCIIFVCAKWFITGSAGLPKWWLDNIHRPWASKLRL